MKEIKQQDFRKYVEDTYWVFFVDWLRYSSLGLRDGEDISTLFWYWYIKVAAPQDFKVLVDTMPDSAQSKSEEEG